MYLVPQSIDMKKRRYPPPPPSKKKFTMFTKPWKPSSGALSQNFHTMCGPVCKFVYKGIQTASAVKALMAKFL